MYDINYFSVYKKKKAKNSNLKIFAIIFLGIFVLGNLLMIGIYLLNTTMLTKSISDLESQINSKDTMEKIAWAAKIKQEAILTNEYLLLIASSSNKIDQMDKLNTALLDKIRSLTPAATSFTFAEYNGILVNLDCTSSLITDPMDMYHAFLNDPAFATVTLSGISADETGKVLFSIMCQLAGGKSK